MAVLVGVAGTICIPMTVVGALEAKSEAGKFG